MTRSWKRPRGLLAMTTSGRILIFCVVGSLLGALGAIPASYSEETAKTEMSIDLPVETVTFKPGPHQTLAQSYCLICHSADYVYMQPPQSQEGWKEVVNKMQKTFGCPIPDSQVQDLVDYLYSQNGAAH